MPRRSGEAAKEGSLRSPLGRASARQASEHATREGCHAVAPRSGAQADRRKVVWGS
jgi:hypothetical protein